MKRRFLTMGVAVLGIVASVLVSLTPTVANAATSGPVAVVAPAVSVQNCNGRSEEFVRGSDNALWHRWQTTPGGSWSAWHSLGGYLISAVDAVPNVNCHLEVFGVGGDHAMWHIWQTVAGGGPWSNWSSLGGYLTSRPYAGRTLGGRVFVGALGGDSNLWCDAQINPATGPWTGWYRNHNQCP